MKKKPPAPPIDLSALLPDYEITPVPEGVDPVELLKHTIDNCPECQAARARGEIPQIVTIKPESRQVRRARQRKVARWMRN